MGASRLNFNAPYQRGVRSSKRVTVTIAEPYGILDDEVKYRLVKVSAWRKDDTRESYEDELTAELNFDSVYTILWSPYWANLFRDHTQYAFEDEYGVAGVIKYVRDMGTHRKVIEIYIERKKAVDLELPDITSVLGVGGRSLTVDGHPLGV